LRSQLCAPAEWYSYIDFLKWGWHSQMINQFENYPDVLLNGRPVLEFYDITQTKWAALGYESLFFIFFFFCALTVSSKSFLASQRDVRI
jgi:hypothetical protein